MQKSMDINSKRVTHLRPPQLHRYCQWGQSVGHTALHAHPTRYMCEYGVCRGGGDNIGFGNTTAADGEIQRQKDY